MTVKTQKDKGRGQFFRLLCRLATGCLALLSAESAKTAEAEAQVESASLQVRAGRVLVVANREFPDSLEIANAYMRARGLPPANLLEISTASAVAVDAATFEEEIMTPVRERLDLLGRAVDYIAITRGVPYRTARKSTAAALMFGGFDQIKERHGFFGQERAFDGTIPVFGISLRPTTGLITYTVEDALKLIERSLVRYDSAAEPGRFYLCQGAGPRGIRNQQIRQALLMLEARGARATQVGNHNIRNRNDVMMQVTGAPTIHLSSNTYLPGSIIDNLTSFGGYLLEERNQSSITSFVQHGACGAYGTVVEPTNIPTRWAQLSMPARYASGFNLIESYLQTILDFSLGMVVGDPLLAPYARPPRLELREREPATSSLEVVAREGIDNQGVAWMEIWLNDEQPVATLVPMLPGGARATLVLRSGEDEIFRREHVLAGHRPLPQLLREFAVQPSDQLPLEIVPAGRYGDKLLVRVGPALLQHGGITVGLTIEHNDKSHARTLPLGTMPIMGRVAILDFAGGEAWPGDEVRITAAGEMALARAGHRQSAAAIAQMTIQRLNERHPAFGEDGDWIAAQGPGQQVWIVHKSNASRRTMPIILNIQRAPRSEFAPELKEGRLSWSTRPVGAIGETVLAPYLPTSEMRQNIGFRRDQLPIGFNRFTVAAGTPAGAEDFTALEIEADDPERPLPRVQWSGDLFNPGDDLRLRIRATDWLDEARPHLIVNGRAVAAFAPAEEEFTYALRMPEIAPGLHEVWLEWLEDDYVGKIAVPRRPLARSRPHRLRVRRPLTAGLELESETLPPGQAVELKLQGPYLHAGVRIEVAGRELELRRDPRFGLRWLTDLEPLPSGEYEIQVTGDPDHDQAGTLGTRLRIAPEE